MIISRTFIVHKYNKVTEMVRLRENLRRKILLDVFQQINLVIYASNNNYITILIVLYVVKHNCLQITLFPD
jgi:hypothetical protein